MHNAGKAPDRGVIGRDGTALALGLGKFTDPLEHTEVLAVALPQESALEIAVLAAEPVDNVDVGVVRSEAAHLHPVIEILSVATSSWDRQKLGFTPYTMRNILSQRRLIPDPADHAHVVTDEGTHGHRVEGQRAGLLVSGLCNARQ